MSLRTSRLARCGAVALSAALLATVLLAAPARAAEGDPSITYDAAENVLTVGGGSGSTDLFAAFKGVVPGDTLTQDVTVDLRNVSAPTRLYVRADTSRVDQATIDALAQGVTLSVAVDAAEGVTAPTDSGTPFDVLASEDGVLVAEVTASVATTMHLTLEVDTSVGNEVADLSAHVPWVITVEEEDTGEGDSTALTPHATDLVAYEGGVGSSATDGADALPEPEWVNVDWETARVTVDNRVWDVVEQGLPFRWAYGTVAADPDLVTTSARAGAYYLLAAPLEGNPVVTVNGKLLTLPEDYVVAMSDGSDVIMLVRDVTDDAGADALASDLFRDVYGAAEAPSVLSRLNALLVDTAWAAPAGDSALDGSFTVTGTHDGDCDNTEPHAHVADGTTFLRNGRADLPVREGARIALLWDDFIDGVLGEPEREGVLDAKAREAVGWEDAEGVQRRFKYLDLVDMNDGNVWVGTADGSSVTVFVPYFEGISADDEIAVARFDGLTRDYTVDMAAADLDAEIAATGAHAVEVTKTEDGILFDVPSGEFGPFELLWRDGSAGGGQTGDGGNTGGETAGGTVDDKTDRPHVEALPQTGDRVPLLAALIACVAALLLAGGSMLRHRRCRQDADRT